MTVLLLAPMRAEARSLRRGTPVPVLHTGTGPIRSSRSAVRLAHRDVAVAGVGGGLAAGLGTGEVVVASEVRGPGADPVVPLSDVEGLATVLRAGGLTVHIGPVVSARRIVTGEHRAALAATGALLADTESYWLLAGPVRPLACVRVVADPVGRPVLTPATLLHLRTALCHLPVVAGALTGWAASRDPAQQTVRGLREVR